MNRKFRITGQVILILLWQWCKSRSLATKMLFFGGSILLPWISWCTFSSISSFWCFLNISAVIWCHTWAAVKQFGQVRHRRLLIISPHTFTQKLEVKAVPFPFPESVRRSYAIRFVIVLPGKYLAWLCMSKLSLHSDTRPKGFRKLYIP